uniref:Eukaryotic elongation factor, selenocysteine-tRNA-specific n=1 Tax=Cyprinus carpio carpio TaxID=630221 RepID=A0A8C1D2B2_CYPCA
MAESSPPNTLNFNVGVLGHVDSGKTSFARALNSTASTAHLRESCGDRQYDSLQFTLVDCTGHASLIRTIIGSAQIIDLRMLVVDVVKGMQTQTAECLLIGQLTCSHTIVILNKTDLLPSCPIIAVAAKPGGPEFPETDEPQGIPGLIDLLKAQAFFPHRDPSGSLLMAVDHCFSIRGQGTVITGTILQGSLSVNDTVEIPALKVTDDYTVIGRNLFKKETNLQLFVGGFGQRGIVHEYLFIISLLLEGLKEETKQLLSSSSKKKGKGGAKNESSKLEETKPDAQPVTIHLNFKRYIYDPHKKMVQS